MFDFRCPGCDGSRFWIHEDGSHFCSACRPPGDAEVPLVDYDTDDPLAVGKVWHATAQKVGVPVHGLALATAASMAFHPPTTPGGFREVSEHLEGMIAQLRAAVDTVREAAIKAQQDVSEWN